MKLWNKSIWLTNRLCVLITIGVLFSTLVIASVWSKKVEVIIVETEGQVEMWIPTAEDIAYQDSMYVIIESTQNDINDIKDDIIFILERLDYEDGTYDSIRYVKGGTRDKKRN